MNVYVTSAALDIYGCENSVQQLLQRLVPYYHVPTDRQRCLFGSEVSLNAFTDNIRWLSSKLKSEACVGILLWSGHGNNVGMTEYYQLPDGNLTDVTLSEMFDDMHPSSLLIVISECCDSAEELESQVNGKPFVGNWITFGATQHYQDDNCSYIGPLTECIIEDWSKIIDQTTQQISETITQSMHVSWVGDLQTPTIQVSAPHIWQQQPFHWHLPLE